MPSEEFVRGLADTLSFGIDRETENRIKQDNAMAEQAIERRIEERERLFQMGEQARDNMQQAADRKLQIDLETIKGVFAQRRAETLAASGLAKEQLKGETRVATRPAKRSPTNMTQTTGIDRRIAELNRRFGVVGDLIGSPLDYDEVEAGQIRQNLLDLQSAKSKLEGDAGFSYDPTTYNQLVRGAAELEDEEMIKAIRESGL